MERLPSPPPDQADRVEIDGFRDKIDLKWVDSIGQATVEMSGFRGMQARVEMGGFRDKLGLKWVDSGASYG